MNFPYHTESVLQYVNHLKHKQIFDKMSEKNCLLSMKWGEGTPSGGISQNNFSFNPSRTTGAMFFMALGIEWSLTNLTSRRRENNLKNQNFNKKSELLGLVVT